MSILAEGSSERSEQCSKSYGIMRKPNILASRIPYHQPTSGKKQTKIPKKRAYCGHETRAELSDIELGEFTSFSPKKEGVLHLQNSPKKVCVFVSFCEIDVFCGEHWVEFGEI